MVYGLFIAILIMLVGFILYQNGSDTEAFVFCMGFCALLFMGILTFSTAQRIKSLKEQMKNVQYYSVREVAEINKRIANIKVHPVLYAHLIDADEIEYIDLDSASPIKVKGE